MSLTCVDNLRPKFEHSAHTFMCFCASEGPSFVVGGPWRKHWAFSASLRQASRLSIRLCLPLVNNRNTIFYPKNLLFLKNSIEFHRQIAPGPKRWLAFVRREPVIWSSERALRHGRLSSPLRHPSPARHACSGPVIPFQRNNSILLSQ